MKVTSLGSRLTQVLVEVLPKSTLRIYFPETLFGLTAAVVFRPVGMLEVTLFMGIAAAFMGVAAEGWSVMKAPNTEF
jgi:hypothetical protein